MDSHIVCRDYYSNVLQPSSVDVIITDPPYERQPDVSKLLTASRGNVVIFSDPRVRPPNDVRAPDEILHWVKTPSTKNTSKACSRFVEEILVWRKGPVFNRIHWSCMVGVYHDVVLENPPFHPWQKPTSLLEKLVLIYSKPGDLVFDPFMGSGTTGVACCRNNRDFLGWELDKDTFAVAEGRLHELIRRE